MMQEYQTCKEHEVECQTKGRRIAFDSRDVVTAVGLLVLVVKVSMIIDF